MCVLNFSNSRFVRLVKINAIKIGINFTPANKFTLFNVCLFCFRACPPLRCRQAAVCAIRLPIRSLRRCSLCGWDRAERKKPAVEAGFVSLLLFKESNIFTNLT